MITQFDTDLKKPMQGADNLGIYNLLVTKRDMHLYCIGIKPNKNFKINDVKKYFGLKGNKFDVDKKIREMVNRAMLGEYDNR